MGLVSGPFIPPALGVEICHNTCLWHSERKRLGWGGTGWEEVRSRPGWGLGLAMASTAGSWIPTYGWAIWHGAAPVSADIIAGGDSGSPIAGVQAFLGGRRQASPPPEKTPVPAVASTGSSSSHFGLAASHHFDIAARQLRIGLSVDAGSITDICSPS